MRARRAIPPSRRRLQRLVEIGEDVVDVLDADGQANVIVGDAGRQLLFGRELRVGGARRMDGERARVADVGDMIEELERVDELGAGGLAALDLEADQAALPALQIFLRPPLGLALLIARDGSRS